jgi:pentatricopeptide repeat protein
MARKLLGSFLVGIACLCFAPATHAGEEALKKELTELNLLTGNDPMRGALKALIDDPKHAKELVKYGLPAAKKKEMSYNGAIVLGLVAADLKDLKATEAYLRVCIDHAIKVQSVDKLQQSYGLIIELYYDAKQFSDCSRLCKELLELNTDDGKDRKVIATMTNEFKEADFREPRPGFDTAERLRPYVREIYIKSLAKQKRYEKALELIEAMLKQNDDWIDQHLKAWVLNEANRLEESAKVYEKIIRKVADDDRLEPSQQDAFTIQFRYEVSNIYIEMKKIDRATAHLEHLVKLRPENPVFQNDLGFVWADNDMKLKEAEAMIRKAIDLDREQRKKREDFDPKNDHDSGAYLDSLGWVLFKQKKNEEAKEWLLKAIEDKKAQHIEIFDHLGDVLLVLGERDAAVRAYEDGLKAVTDNRRDQERKAAVEKKLEKLKISK